MKSNPGNPIEILSVRPQFFVEDQEIDRLAADLLNVSVEETNAGGSRCEAIFANWGSVGGAADFIYFDRKILDFGKRFSVRAGAKETGIEIFTGRITAIEARYPDSRPPEIMVLAEDGLQDLRRTRRTRTFEEIDDRNLIQLIAGEHGLPADVDVDGPVHRALAQVNRSDLDFLRARVQAIDAELWFEAGALHAQARSRRNAGAVTLAYGEKLRHFAVTADLAEQCSLLTVSGWDVNAKESIASEASEAAILAELDGAQSGSSVLANALGPRIESVVDLVPHSQEEAGTLAEAQYRMRARRFLTGRGVCEGDGRLRVGTHLTLQGLGGLFNGTYYVTQVVHSFTNQDGFVTQFSVEGPGLGKEIKSDAAATKISFRPGQQR